MSAEHPRFFPQLSPSFLLKMAPAVVKPYVILGLFAGIRPEELLRLKWADVCLETKTVTVNDAKTRRLKARAES